MNKPTPAELAGKIIYTLGMPEIKQYAWKAFDLVCRRAKEGAPNAIKVKAAIRQIVAKLRGR
jgi:hypothetical protein